MQSRIVLTMILLSVISTIGASQDEVPKEAFDRAWNEWERLENLPEDIRSLVGVKGVYVFVRDLRDDAKAASLTVEQLRTDVELRLRLAAIKVNSWEEGRDSEDGAYLDVSVQTSGRSGLFALNISLAFRQNVCLARKPNRPLAGASTWDDGQIGTTGALYLAETARQTVRDLTDSFINAYLTANPKPK